MGLCFKTSHLLGYRDLTSAVWLESGSTSERSYDLAEFCSLLLEMSTVFFWEAILCLAL